MHKFGDLVRLDWLDDVARDAKRGRSEFFAPPPTSGWLLSPWECTWHLAAMRMTSDGSLQSPLEAESRSGL